MQTYKIRTCDCGRVLTGRQVRHCSHRCRSRVNMQKMKVRRDVEQALDQVLKNEE